MLVINDYENTNYSQSIYCSGQSISVDSENTSNPFDTRQFPSGMVVWLQKGSAPVTVLSKGTLDSKLE